MSVILWFVVVPVGTMVFPLCSDHFRTKQKRSLNARSLVSLLDSRQNLVLYAGDHYHNGQYPSGTNTVWTRENNNSQLRHEPGVRRVESISSRAKILDLTKECKFGLDPSRVRWLRRLSRLVALSSSISFFFLWLRQVRPLQQDRGSSWVDD